MAYILCRIAYEHTVVMFTCSMNCFLPFCSRLKKAGQMSTHWIVYEEHNGFVNEALKETRSNFFSHDMERWGRNVFCISSLKGG